MQDEGSGIVTNLDDFGVAPFLNATIDVARVQHPNIDSLNKSLHELKDMTRVSYNDPYLEAKLWPQLFPFGNGGWFHSSLLKAGEYLKHRLLNFDSRWRKDESFSFHWYDRQVKSRLFYVAKARQAKRKDRTDNLTSCKLQDGTFYDKLGNIVPATITGSRSNWNSKLLDLLALSRKLGKPTFFITLTQNDNWPEIQNHIINGPGHEQPEIDIDSEFELNDIHPSREFSVETVTAYSNRLKLFKKEVIRNPNGPLGRVIDWWHRKESQSRGAIHNHMVVWCKEGTIPENVVCAEVPRGAEDNPTVNSLKSFVRRLQMHRCRKNKCNVDSRGRPLKKCKYGFPYPVQEEERMNNAGNRFLPRRRCYEDTLVVPYNQEILYLWGAHMNIQKVTESGWEMYLTKYVATGEPSFKLEISKDASEPEKYLRTRVVGRLEVDHINLGHFLCCASRQVTYLPTDLNPVYGFLKRNKDLPADPDSDDVFYSNTLDKYMERPVELESVRYVEWAEKYMLARSGKAPNRDRLVAQNDCSDNDDDNKNDHHDIDNRKLIFTDLKGREWKKRKTEAVARWKFFIPNGENQEDYYMQKLVLNVPLRKESPIISAENQSGTYMEECAIRQLLLEEDDALNALDDARQRGFSIDRLRKMAQSLKDMEWIGQDEFNMFIDEVETVHNANTECQKEVLDANVDEGEQADSTNLAMNINRIDLEEFQSTLTPSQQQAYQYITQTLSTGKQVLTALIGEAGTGKSYLLKGIVEHAVSVLHLTARKLATTGVAAHLIGGETLHHFLQMNIHCKSRLERGTIEYDVISNTDLIIIDEFSLLEMRPFLTTDRILRDIANAKNEENMPFGGKHIILMGDPAQLPAIEEDIFDTFLWKKFDIVMLKDVKRQNDEAFQSILSTVRMGRTTPEIDSVLRSRVLPNIEINNINIDDAGAAIICSLRKERDAWNKIFLNRLDNGESEYTFEAEDTDATGNPLPEKDKRRIRWFHRERLEDSLTLKVGARVVLCKNIDTEHGWLNGTLAKVVSIHSNCITIENIKTGRKTVVTRIRQNVSFPGSSIQYFRTQFPLMLGWALTVHKVQGMTLDRAYILLSKNFFASGQAYVALSRIKCIDSLYLLEYDPKAVCLDDYYKGLLEWMKVVDKIGNNSSIGNKNNNAIEVEYPERPKVLHASVRRKKTQLKRNMPKETPSTGTVTASKMAPEKREKSIIEFAGSEQISNSCSERLAPELNEIWQSFDLPLDASKETYIVQHREQFEAILDILRNRDVAMFQPGYMHADHYQQSLLHPVMQTYLMAAHTVGDGNCLFHSIWKQLFPQQEENPDTARFMRQITLYVIYKDENRFREMVAALGYNYSFDQYLRDIGQMGCYCGDLALSALADAVNRPIYCYNSFMNNATGRFFFENFDFESLKSMFLTRKQGTWQHNLFTPRRTQPLVTSSASSEMVSTQARTALKIMFTVNHFTALLNTRMQEDIMPQTNNFNIHEVLREE